MKKIAEIRDALTKIDLAAEAIDYHYPVKAENGLITIREQVKRIDKILLRLLEKAENPKNRNPDG